MIETLIEFLWGLVRYIKRNTVEVVITSGGMTLAFFVLTSIACTDASEALDEAVEDSSLVVQEVPVQDTVLSPDEPTTRVRVDTVLVLSDLMPLDSIAKALGVTSEFIWDSYLEHSASSGYTGIIGLLCCFVLLIVGCRVLVWILPKVDATNNDKQEVHNVVISLVTGVIVLMSIIGTVVFMFESVYGPAKIINKEYYALQDIIELVIDKE